MDPIKRLGISLFFEFSSYMAPFFLLFYMENGLTINDFILFQSIFFCGALVLELPTGYISDLFSKKHIILIAYLFNLFKLFLYLYFSGYFVVLIGEICFTLHKSFLSGSIDSYIYEYLKQNNSAKMVSKYGRVFSKMAYGTAFSTIFGYFLYNSWGIGSLIMAELISNIIAVVIVLSLPNIIIHHKKKVRLQQLQQSIVFIYHKPLLCHLIIFAAICFALTSLFSTLFQPILKSISAPAVLFSSIYFVNQILRGFTSRFSKEIMRYIGIYRISKLTITLIILTVSGFFLNSLFHFSTILIFLILLISCISIAFHLFFQIIAISKLHKVLPDNLRATSSSLLNMLFRGLAGVMLFLFKNTTEKLGSGLTFLLFLIFLCGLSAMMFLYIKRKVKKVQR